MVYIEINGVRLRQETLLAIGEAVVGQACVVLLLVLANLGCFRPRDPKAIDRTGSERAVLLPDVVQDLRGRGAKDQKHLGQVRTPEADAPRAPQWPPQTNPEAQPPA